jgi:serine/threonine protein kinase
MYLITPLVEDKKEKLRSVEFIRLCIRQILQTLHYIHSLGFAHLDVKPDNILFDGSRLVIIDFGHSLPLKEIHNASVGTGSYSSPELHYDICREFSEKIDIWSVAVMMYEWLTGKRLFHVDSNEFERLAKIEKFVDTMRKDGFFQFHDSVELKGRDLALVRDLLNSMFEPRPKTRASARECLRNEWLSSASQGEQKSNQLLSPVNATPSDGSALATSDTSSMPADPIADSDTESTNSTASDTSSMSPVL